jgi:hypothetical protein
MTSILNDRTTDLITSICDDLPLIDAAIARRYKTSSDIPPHDGFYDYFRAFKVSFCQPSLDIFLAVSQIPDISAVVEHITFGTETLDQYAHVINAAKGKDAARWQVAYDDLLKDWRRARLDVVPVLREALMRFPILSSIKVEDPPSGSGANPYDDYLPSFGTASLKRTTGIDLEHCQPPLPLPRPRPSSDSSSRASTHNISPAIPIPINPKQNQSHAFVYAVIFILLRDLDILGHALHLDLVISGHAGSFIPPFAPRKALPRRAVARYVRRVDVRGLDTRPARRGGGVLQEFLVQMRGECVVFTRCVVKEELLKRVLVGFGEVVLRSCVNK